MIGRKSILSLCVVFALALSAMVAQSASASNGTTLFTCAKESSPGAGFKAAHCTESDAVATNSTFQHKTIAENTTTEVIGTTTNTAGAPTPSTLKSVQNGITFELSSELAHLKEASLTNKRDITTNEHYFEGEGVIEFTNVQVAAPAGKGCKVKGGKIVTNKIRTKSKGAGDSVISEPVVGGGNFAEFELEGCTGSKALEALNIAYSVTGTATCVPHGATLDCTEAKTTETLKLRGQAAGFEASFTIEGRDPTLKETLYTPLSPTTVT